MLKAADIGQRWMKGVSGEFALKGLRQRPIHWYRLPLVRNSPGPAAPGASLWANSSPDHEFSGQRANSLRFDCRS
jgi:hypothetical protein